MSTSDGSTRKHSHYHKDVGHLLTMDVYRLCERFEINDPSGATQHAIKKLVCAGQRGSKGLLQDLQEAVDTINRRIEMIYEDEARDALMSAAFGQQNMIDPAGVDIASEIDDDSERMQAIGQNGNGGEHYGAPDWSKAPDNAVAYVDWTGSAARLASAFYSDGGDRFHRLDDGIPTHQYVLKLDDGRMDIDYPYFMRPAK